MKKLWILGFTILLLTGCGSQTVFETVEDVMVQPAAGIIRQIGIDLPPEAAVTVMQNEAGESLYLCDGYTLTVQTLPGGDLDRTLRTLTGFGTDSLSPMQTRQGDVKRSECVWSAAGEGELQVGRLAVLDDGNYHYAISVMASQSAAGELADTWQALFDSFTVQDIAA